MIGFCLMKNNCIGFDQNFASSPSFLMNSRQTRRFSILKNCHKLLYIMSLLCGYDSSAAQGTKNYREYKEKTHVQQE